MSKSSNQTFINMLGSSYRTILKLIFVFMLETLSKDHVFIGISNIYIINPFILFYFCVYMVCVYACVCVWTHLYVQVYMCMCVYRLLVVVFDVSLILLRQGVLLNQKLPCD